MKISSRVMAFTMMHFVCTGLLALFFAASIQEYGPEYTAAIHGDFLYILTKILVRPAYEIQLYLHAHFNCQGGIWLVPFYMVNSLIWGYGLSRLAGFLARYLNKRIL